MMEKVAEREELELVRHYLQGDQQAASGFVRHYQLSFRRHIIRVLRLRHAIDDANNREILEDILQNSYCAIFSHDAKVLRRYDPERGMSLRRYLLMIVARETNNYLDQKWNQKRGGRSGEVLLGPCETLATPVTQPFQSPEIRYYFSRILELLADLLEKRLTPRGQLAFRLMYIENLSTSEIQTHLGGSADCVYTWKKRLRRVVTDILRGMGVLEPCL